MPPPLTRLSSRIAHTWIRILHIVLVAVCILLRLPCAFAQLTEVFPAVKTAVAIDQAANVMYYTHSTNNRISAVLLATGLETQYSLGAALSQPTGLAVDASEMGAPTLLIADAALNRILRINTTTGDVIATYTTS